MVGKKTGQGKDQGQNREMTKEHKLRLSPVVKPQAHVLQLDRQD